MLKIIESSNHVETIKEGCESNGKGYRDMVIGVLLKLDEIVFEVVDSGREGVMRYLYTCR